MNYKRKIIIFLLHIFVFTSFTNAQSTKIKDLENRRVQLKKEIKEINGLLIDNTKQAKMAYGDLENISIKINRNQDLIKINNEQINLLTSTIVYNEKKVNQLIKDVNKAKKDYSKMIYNSYKSRLQESRLMFLLSSENFLQALKRTQYMNQYSDNRRNYANKIESNIKKIKLINDTINMNINNKENLLIENKLEEKKLTQEKNKQNNLIKGLKRKEKNYKNEIDMMSLKN